jgi:hypothetical protein
MRELADPYWLFEIADEAGGAEPVTVADGQRAQSHDWDP